MRRRAFFLTGLLALPAKLFKGETPEPEKDTLPCGCTRCEQCMLKGSQVPDVNLAETTIGHAIGYDPAGPDGDYTAITAIHCHDVARTPQAITDSLEIAQRLRDLHQAEDLEVDPTAFFQKYDGDYFKLDPALKTLHDISDVHLLALTEWFIEFCQSIEVNPLDFPGSRLLRDLIHLVSSPAYRTRPPESLDYYHLDELAYDLGDFYDVEFGSCSADEDSGEVWGLFRAGYLPHMGILAVFPWVVEQANQHKRCTNCLEQELTKRTRWELGRLVGTARSEFVHQAMALDRRIGPPSSKYRISGGYWHCEQCRYHSAKAVLR